MMLSLTCINCPLGCQLSVAIEDGKVISVAGNSCPRGDAYARQEAVAPKRTVASTVRISGQGRRRLPVKTVPEVPKESIPAVMDAIHRITAVPPVSIGDIICHDIAGTGSDLVATAPAKPL